MTALRRTGLTLALGALALALALGGQAGTDALADDEHDVGIISSVGSASSSYLTGLKTFAGSVLWNRIGPVFHEYYGGVSLEDQRYMLSTIAAVEWLYPTLEEPYYIGSWILAQNDRLDRGFEMIRRGLDVMPRSGMLRAGHAQMLYLYADLEDAVAEGRVAIGDRMEWRSDEDRLESYAEVAAIFRAAGQEQLAQHVARLIDELDASIDHTADPMVHDHDGDGVPDH